MIIIGGDDVHFSGTCVSFAAGSSCSKFQVQLAKELGSFDLEAPRHHIIVLQQLFTHGICWSLLNIWEANEDSHVCHMYSSVFSEESTKLIS